jgi:hypothetical protein
MEDLVMSIISIIVVLAVVGFLLWLINAYIPMQPAIKNILNIVIIGLVLLWILNIIFGLGVLGTTVRIR